MVADSFYWYVQVSYTMDTSYSQTEHAIYRNKPHRIYAHSLITAVVDPYVSFQNKHHTQTLSEPVFWAVDHTSPGYAVAQTVVGFLDQTGV